MDLKLYEIPSAIRAALDAVQVDEETGEIVGLDNVRAVELGANEKFLATAKYIKHKTAQIDEIKAQIKVWQDRLKSEQSRIDKLKDFTLRMMNGAGLTRVSDTEIILSVAKKPASVAIFDEDQIPVDLMRVHLTREPDKTAIKSRLKAGEDVPGAKLVDDEMRLAIK